MNVLKLSSWISEIAVEFEVIAWPGVRSNAASKTAGAVTNSFLRETRSILVRLRKMTVLVLVLT